MTQPPSTLRRRGNSDVAPSMQDVAVQAGVAIGTVSNVLNNPAKVAEGTRLKVEAAIAELGFVRNSAARSLAAGTTDTIGMVLVDIGNSFFVDIARGAERATSAAGLRILLANSDVDQARQDGYLELFDEARATGLILAPLDGPLTAAHSVQSHGRPVVLVNAPAVDQSMCSVIVDDELGGYLAANHLISRGCRELAFLGGPFSLHAIRRRLDGARRAVAEASGVNIQVVETHSLNIGSGRNIGFELLRSNSAIDGIFCSSDPLAVGAINAATELGIEVPSRLAVIGYDDNHFASESSIPVSTIGQPGASMGEAATQLLLEEIHDWAEHAHRTVTLRPWVIARRSTQR